MALLLASPKSKTCVMGEFRKVLLWSTFCISPYSCLQSETQTADFSEQLSDHKWNNAWCTHPVLRLCRSKHAKQPQQLSGAVAAAVPSLPLIVELSPALPSPPANFCEISTNFYVGSVPCWGVSDPTAQGQDIWGWEMWGREAGAQSKGQRADLLPGLLPLRSGDFGPSRAHT